MGYAEYLTRLLEPLNVYDLDTGYGAGEIYALGDALDGVSAGTAELDRECVVAAASGYGLDRYAELLPAARGESAQERRNALAALMRMWNQTPTAQSLTEQLNAAGITATVSESGTRQRVRISFYGFRGLPEDLNGTLNTIRMFLPCHLSAEYIFQCPIWEDIENAFPLWGDIEGMTFAELERFEYGA